MVPSTKHAPHQDKFALTNTNDERHGNDAADEGQTTTDELAEMLRDYAVECVVHHTGKGTKDIYVIPLCSFTPAADSVKPPKLVPKHFITPYWLWNQKKDAGPQRRRQHTSTGEDMYQSSRYGQREQQY